MLIACCDVAWLKLDFLIGIVELMDEDDAFIDDMLEEEGEGVEDIVVSSLDVANLCSIVCMRRSF